MCRSAYLHIPFCKEICSYCDFTRCRYHQGLADRWLHRIEEEIEEKLKGCNLDTLYLGGGTPSALTYEQLHRLLKALHPYIQTCKEVTMEANIESFTEEKMKLCHAYGIHRISLGVQSLQPELLRMIKRGHQREEIEESIQKIKKHGIHNISIDLIYGLPKQTLAMWKEDLSYVVEHYDIQHISMYALTIEEHSEFGRMKVQNIGEEEEADMYEYAVSFLKQHGFIHYEISNFAKPGYASQHNLAYWHYDDFVGLGMGASGKQHHCRYDNTKNLQVYFEKGASPTVISLTKEDEMFEMVMMSLRTKEGLHLDVFQQRYHEDALKIYHKAIHKHQDVLVVEDDCLKVHERGMEILHEILLDFLPEQ